ncbi:magnesium transporter MRS2-F-like isoform X3 [Magnolia sinica]|uniref:magnesium transporter MRS2-F-like isoform X3 n=1 Tax=Magnolia sinica TaxID=86752 RepID=UPI00265B3CDB|nr:magnesium transporter MRS2-F-like isoform X3 [Magnolia sinica]
MRFRDISMKADRIAPVSPLSLSQQQTRWKSAVTKAWFVVSDSGESRIEEVGKYSIMRRTGLPARDLRILDPMLSYPSTVLGRERAIVVNLEDIKAIITATEVLVLSSKSPMVSALVEDLQYRVLNLHRTPRKAAESSDTDMGVTNKGPRYSPSFLSLRKPESPSSMGISQQRHVSLENSMMIPEMEDCSPRSELDGPKDGCPKVLPFEFRVLEGCLQSACKCLESEVRDELEHLLDDDMDMAEMYMTDKLDHQQYEETSSTDEVDDDAFKIDDERRVNYLCIMCGYSISLSSVKHSCCPLIHYKNF